MDAADLTQKTYQVVTLDGQEYRVGHLTYDDWGELIAWIKAHVPSPLAVLKSADLSGLEESHRKELLTIAFAEARNWPPRTGSAAWFRALDTPDGHAELLRVILGKFQPAITTERCKALAPRVDTPAAVELVTIAMGLDDPKAKGPGAGGTASPRPTAPTNGDSSSTRSTAATAT